MQKKALVFAVSAALMVPCAFAQKKGGGGDKEDADPDQVVELYGKLYPELVRQSGSGATAVGNTNGDVRRPGPGRQRGHQPHRDGSRAIRDSACAARRNSEADCGRSSSSRPHSSSTATTLPSRARDSFVGLTHPAWGTIKLAAWIPPFKG
jgi:hypothetical protein